MKKTPDNTKIPATDKATELEKQLNECTERWKRALADYQNLEKRINEEKQDFVRFTLKNFIEKFLNIVDDLEKAAAHLKDEGLNLAIKKLHVLLREEGVEKIETLGKAYDIHTMEAIHVVEGKEDNLVVAEHRPGYKMHGAILRAAQATVSKKK